MAKQFRCGPAVVAKSACTDAARLLEGLPAAVLALDGSGVVFYCNTAARRDLPQGETIASVLRNATVSPAVADWAAELRGIAAGGQARRYELIIGSPEVQAESRACQAGGRGRRGESTTAARAFFACMVAPADLGPIGAGFVLQAIPQHGAAGGDERHEIALRLASLGKMAARVAHELNNPLDGILRYINLALRLAGETPEPRLKAYLSESRTGLLRMIEIISDLLEYSRATAGAFDEMSINEVVEQAVRSTAERAAACGVIVAVDFQTMQMPLVRGGRLYQVCCNVLRNAIDAMAAGGRLSIVTGVIGGNAVIRVADTGSGLPEPVEKIFEPFYTTKPAGKGTGLGLAISRDFLEDMGGSITAERGEPRGAVLTIRIPVSRCAPAEARSAAAVEGS